MFTNPTQWNFIVCNSDKNNHNKYGKLSICMKFY